MTRPDSNNHDVNNDGDGDCNGYGWDYDLFVGRSVDCLCLKLWHQMGMNCDEA